jgi:CBS-domain-containing membrane protein
MKTMNEKKILQNNIKDLQQQLAQCHIRVKELLDENSRLQGLVKHRQELIKENESV